MKIILNSKETEFYNTFINLKKESGLHSPSIHKLLKIFPQLKIQIDACFLCNPYAYDIFMKSMNRVNLEKYIKFYPPQNEEIAENIAKFRKVPQENILIGNGAIEIIENLFKFVKNQKILVTLPTFSTYYEIGCIENTIIPLFLKKENDFKIDVNSTIEFVEKNKIDIIILVNPNNPTGCLLNSQEIIKIHQNFPRDKTFIIDESFIDFSSNNESIEKYAINHNNIIIIKSLSKDFGIAGIRLGYAIMSNDLRKKYLKTGFLWNSNGIAYYFSTLLGDINFQNQYIEAKNTYNFFRDEFFKELSQIKEIKVYPSQANFFMIETSENSEVLFTKLLYQHGIYTRILNDKWGLEGNFLRIASKDKRENLKMIHAFKSIF